MEVVGALAGQASFPGCGLGHSTLAIAAGDTGLSLLSTMCSCAEGWLLSALGAFLQVQQQHLQQQVMQQHASGLGGDHDALSRNASPAQRVFAARMDTIVRSLTNEAQSARDAFLREVAASSEGSNGNGGGGGGGSHGRGRGAYRQLQNGPGADRVWDSAATTAGLVRSLVEALARLIAAVSTRPLPEF